jgi:DNA repair exonuclease SbcCD ATPase subunit
MKKTLAISLLLALLAGLSITSVSADETDMNNEERKTHMEEMKAKKEEMKAYMEEKRAEMKANRMEFKDANKDAMKELFKGLSDEDREELKALKAEHKEEMKALRDEMKEAKGDLEARDAAREAMKALRDEHFAELTAVLGEDHAIIAKMKERHEVYKENMEIRKGMHDQRKDFREERKELIGKYKGAFVKRLGDRLDKIPTDKLAKVSEKIDSLYTKIEDNTTMSEDKKATILSQITALQDIIEERLEDVDAEELEIDEEIEDILED